MLVIAAIRLADERGRRNAGLRKFRVRPSAVRRRALLRCRIERSIGRAVRRRSMKAAAVLWSGSPVEHRSAREIEGKERG
jgi:hypothetical protein